ncbi:MAG TPA: DUF2635 domain-containing protein [Gammaproteobacteria bacterium]
MINGVACIVRMPEMNNQVLPEKGTHVPDNSYWRRRLRDGDIERVPAARPAKSNTQTES